MLNMGGRDMYLVLSFTGTLHATLLPISSFQLKHAGGVLFLCCRGIFETHSIACKQAQKQGGCLLPLIKFLIHEKDFSA